MSQEQKRGQAKGRNRARNKDPSEEFENGADSDAADDAQQTLDEIDPENDPADGVAGGEGDDEEQPAAAAGGIVGDEAGQSPVDTDADQLVGEIIEDPDELRDWRDTVKIEKDGEVLIARVIEVNEDTVLLDANNEMFDPENSQLLEPPKSELLDEDTVIRRYDVVDMTEIPGVEKLAPEDGGYNFVPGDMTDSEELVEQLRTADEWCEVAGINQQIADEYPIGEINEAAVKRRLTEDIANFRNPELRREYIRRTVLGGGRDIPGNTAIYTENGRPMNAMVAGEIYDPDSISHEAGHGMAQMCGVVNTGSGGISDDKRNPWNTNVDPLNSEAFKKHMHVKSGAIHDSTQTVDNEAMGWDEWASDARERVVSSTDFEPVSSGTAVGREIETGDTVRFDSAPFAGSSSKQWEVVEAPDFDDSVPQVTVKSPNGAVREVSAIGDHRNPEATRGELGVDASPTHIGRGTATAGGNSATGTPSKETPTVDELRSEYSDRTDGWEDKMDNFASQANRAFYEMHLRNEVKGERVGIKNSYAGYKSHEVMAQMNEVFQTKNSTMAESVESTVRKYPEVTAAYLELKEPSETVKDELKRLNRQRSRFSISIG